MYKQVNKERQMVQNKASLYAQGDKESLLLAFKASSAELSMTTAFALLQENDVWIAEIGASSHSTKCNSGTVKLVKSGSIRLAERQ